MAEGEEQMKIAVNKKRRWLLAFGAHFTSAFQPHPSQEKKNK